METKINVHKVTRETIQNKKEPKIFNWKYKNQMNNISKNTNIKNSNFPNINSAKNRLNSNNKIISGNSISRKINEPIKLTYKLKNKNSVTPKVELLNNFNKTNTTFYEKKFNKNKENDIKLDNVAYKTIVVKNNPNIQKNNINLKNKSILDNIKKNNNYIICNKSDIPNNNYVKIKNDNNIIKVNLNNNLENKKNNNKNDNIINQLFKRNNHNKITFYNYLKNENENKEIKLKNQNINNDKVIKNDDDKNNKKENIEENNEITYENYLCFKCKEKAFIELDLNTLLITMKCTQGHCLKNIPIKEFKLKNDLSNKINCYGCRNNNLKIKDLYYCSCRKILCLKCLNKKEHNTHFKVKFLKKNYFCFKHNQKYESFCKKCNRHICTDCLQEHKTHNENNENIFYLNKNTPTQREIKIYKNNLDKIKKMNLIKILKITWN